MFRELPSKKASSHQLPLDLSVSFLNYDYQEYPDYFHTISSPIAISTIRKRSSGTHYKTVTQYLNDWRLMFNNARTYNQEGSWVYVDAESLRPRRVPAELEKATGLKVHASLKEAGHG